MDPLTQDDLFELWQGRKFGLGQGIFNVGNSKAPMSDVITQVGGLTLYDPRYVRPVGESSVSPEAMALLNNGIIKAMMEDAAYLKGRFSK